MAMGKPCIPSAMETAMLVVYVLATFPDCTMQDLVDRTRTPARSVRRSLAIIRSVFGMNIQYVRPSKTNGLKYGIYKIMDWGIVQPELYLDHVRCLADH